MPDLEIILAELGYGSPWVDYGLLTDDLLHDQYSRYQTGDDKNTEHYRYEAFQALLLNGEMLDMVGMNQYIELAIADIDRSMADAALSLLIQWPGLTNNQLAQIEHHLAFNKPFLRKLQRRITLLRELRSTEITDESFERFLASDDVELHRALLSNPVMKIEYLQKLKERGANKAIRNMAIQMLKHGKNY